ncbi:MAG: tRNA (adenosine(37)-N6)-threonylcarbamoyltransferase complex ATPase subunit type 1 TsaE [Bacteroidota bacterium]
MQNFTTTFSLDKLPRVVTELRDSFPDAKVFTLTGDLGAGKTTLVAEFCRQMGVTHEMSSPTFSIVNEYHYNAGLIFHLDCYRLKDIQEALDLDVETYFEHGQYVFVEWPAIIEPLLPSGVVNLRLDYNPLSPNQRETRTLTATRPRS